MLISSSGWSRIRVDEAALTFRFKDQLFGNWIILDIEVSINPKLVKLVLDLMNATFMPHRKLFEFGQKVVNAVILRIRNVTPQVTDEFMFLI